MIKLNDGFSIPPVLFGTYLISDEKILEECIDKALESGYRGIDTAAVYRNESFIGQILKTKLPKFNLKREDIFITSKLAPIDQGYEKAKLAILQTLKNLDIEYLDLYLIHWPGTAKLDKEAPEQIENRKGSWRALEEAKSKGIIRSIGVSNYMEKHLQEMDKYASVPPAVNQVECHPYLNQSNLVDYCRSRNIHFQAYSSLGTTANHSQLLENETVQSVAKAVGKSVAQILLKWAVTKGFSVLPKSTNLKHIASNIDLFGWDLSVDQMNQLDKLNKEHHFCWNPHTVV